jgi:hypothetical protein
MANKKKLEIKILNKKELGNCKHDKAIVVKLEATYYESDVISFKWESMGESTTTKGEIYSTQKTKNKGERSTSAKKNKSRQNNLQTKEKQRKIDAEERKQYSANDGSSEITEENKKVFLERIFLEQGYWKLYDKGKEPKINLIPKNN